MITLKNYRAKLATILNAKELKAIQARGIRNKRAELILKYIQKRRCPNILEIGRFCGYTLGMFLLASPKSTVTSIDIRMQGGGALHKIINKLAKRPVTLIHGTSDATPDAKYDFVLIDGMHTYAAAKRDWDNVKHKLNPGATVLFDDIALIGNLWDEVRKELGDRIATTAVHADGGNGGGILTLVA